MESDRSSDELPTIIVVQGSFQTPLVYEAFEKSLRSKSYPVSHPSLPSCSDTERQDFPRVTLLDDALVIRNEVSRLVKESKTVVLVMHSYGGLVGNEAIPETLSHRSRQSRNLEGGVIHLFMFAAFILEENKSVLETFGLGPNDDIKPDGRYTMKNGAELVYNDLPAAEAALWESRMIPQSYAVQSTRLTRSAYKYISSTYLICENDRAAPPLYQEAFAGMAGSFVERCNAGHSPMLSQTEMIVGRVVGAIERAVSKGLQ